MKINKNLFIAFATSALWFTASAQEALPQEETTSAKKYSFAATIGYNNYTTANAQEGSLSSYGAEQHASSWLTKSLMIGFEAGGVLKEEIRVVANAGLSYSAYPGYYAIPGVEAAEASIPEYSTIPIQHNLSYTIGAGADYYFKKQETGLAWYAGCRLGFSFAQNSKRYNYADKVEMGVSIARTLDYRVGAVVGAEYYFSENFFVGAQLEGLSYTYGISAIKPQPGLAYRSADHHNIGLLSAPTIKIGFVF